MPLSRRAIIHIGGKKIKKIPKTNIGARKLKLLESVKNDLISGDNTKFSFILDPRKHKKLPINKFIDVNSSKNIKSHYEVPIYDIIIGSDEEMKKIDEKEEEELLAQKEEIKKKIKKKYRAKSENANKRKAMHMGPFLQEIEFDMDYYNDISAKFDKFEKDFFFPKTEENKYNPFRFKVSDNYKNIIELPQEVNMSGMSIQFEKWKSVNKLSVISNDMKILMVQEFEQILKDVYRDGVAFTNRNLGLHTQSHNTEEFLIYCIQISLFKSYIQYVSESKHDAYNKYDFSTFTVTGHPRASSSSVINNMIDDIKEKITNNLSINYNVLDKLLKKNLEKEERHLNNNKKEGEKDIKLKKKIKEVWGQQDVSLVSSAIIITAKEKDKANYHLKDAVALYSYFMIEHKFEEFLKYSNFDKKHSYKMTLKFFSLLKFIDPYMFTKHDIILNKARGRKKMKNIDDMNLGEFFFEKTDKFDSSKTNNKEEWLDQEKDKYNIFKDEELSIEKIVEEISSNQSDDNANLEAFLLVSKKKQDKILFSDKDVLEDEVYFEGEETAMSYYNIIARMLMDILISQNGPHSILMDRFNANNYNLKHFWKSLYKYGINGMILYIGIHIKNMCSAYYLNNRPDNNPMKKYEEKDPLMGIFKEWGDRNMYANTMILGNGPTKNVNGSLLGSNGADRWIYDYKNKITIRGEEGKGVNPHTFRSGVFLNPLTTNIEETYGKHFDYCVDLIEKKHGSMKTFNKEFDKLFNKSLILYKNGYMQQSRLDTVKKEHPGITVINNLNEIWTTHVEDERIHFEKHKRHNSEKISTYDKGWLGNLRGNILLNALDGVYHIDFRKFINDSRNILPPFVEKWYFEKDLIKIYKKPQLFEMPENINKKWPMGSGRPFIFINHIKAIKKGKEDDTQIWSLNKKIFSTKEIKNKINGLRQSRIEVVSNGVFPSYWVTEPKNPFKREDKNNNTKLKYLIEHGEKKYNEELENMNKAMKIEESPIPVKKPVVKRTEYASKDDDDYGKYPLLERKDSDTPLPTPTSSPTPSEIDPNDQALLDKLERGDSISSDGSFNSEDQALLDELEKTTNELDHEVQDTAIRADDLCKEMDKLDSGTDGKFERVKQLVKEGKGNEDIKTTIMNEFPETMDRTITCMIDAAKSNQETESQDEVAEEVQPESAKGPDQQLKEMGLERVKVKDDGDCLFAALAYISKPNRKEEPGDGEIKLLREMIVEYVTTDTSKRERVTHVEENGAEIKENVNFWQINGEDILKAPHGNPVKAAAKEKMYTPRESEGETDRYTKLMTATKADGKNPRARFGTRFEVMAFEEMEEKEIQIIEWNDNEWRVMYPRPPFHENKNTIIYKDLHYDYARPIKTTQSGGGNNVYINKCKNHRHKRTRKFRIRLKNVGDWVHVKKPKKRTRRIY